MIRGEFIRADGLVIPNNVTVYGSALILSAFTRHTVVAFDVALVNCVPDPLIVVADLHEPTVGVHSYGRIGVSQDASGWPTVGTLDGESYAETNFLTWVAVGGPFDKPVNRLALMQDDNVIAISGAMPGDLTIDVDTAESDRKFKYRIYLR